MTKYEAHNIAAGALNSYKTSMAFAAPEMQETHFRYLSQKLFDLIEAIYTVDNQ